jgi:hypothetical protein
MDKQYNLKNIRILLTEGFTTEDLRRLCFDEAAFRPVYDQLAQGMGKAAIIDLLLEHAQKTLQMDRLLAWTEQTNPARYRGHQPYYEVTSGSGPDVGARETSPGGLGPGTPC